jgi:putative membrane protein
LSTGIALVSVFGFKVFSLNPNLLVSTPWALKLYPYAYKAFAQAQILFSALALLFFLKARQTHLWPVAAIGVYALSFFSEFAGTSWGLPFGAYEYTDLLGPKIADKVPYLIPASWFFMGLASYRIALAAPEATHSTLAARLWRIVGATLILVLWDVTLDPAMSYTTPFWIWEQPGRYYGMPWLNIGGWCLTGLGIMLVFDFCPGPHILSRLPLGFFAALYAANMILPVGLLAAVGAWLPIGLTLLLGLGLWSLSRLSSYGSKRVRGPTYSFSVGR